MTIKGVGKDILQYIKESAPRPVSTREISQNLDIAWHTADRYCLKLQIAKKINSFTIGKSTAWYLEK
jgi:predicted transcriptional regulator